VISEYVPSANDLISDIPRDKNFTIDMLLPDLATSYVSSLEAISQDLSGDWIVVAMASFSPVLVPLAI
jgi:hypothetical protein